MPIPGVAGVAGVTGAAQGAFNTAKGVIGGVTDFIGDVFGKAPPDRRASKRLRRTFHRAQAGDEAAIANLKYRAETQGSKFDNINKRAVKYYNMVTGGNAQWREPESSPSPASGGAGRSSGGGSTQSGSTTDSVVTVRVAAPRSERPCKYGPRGTDGYCPKRPPATPRGTSTPRQLAAPVGPKPKRPCKYGPRDAQGYCPPKPKSSRSATRARRQAEQAVERGIRKAAPVVVKYAPDIARFAAKAGLVLAAGAAAYWITSQLMRIRQGTVADLRYELANQYRTARRAYAAQYGRNLSPAELAELSQWYKRKDAQLRAYGPDTKKVLGTFKWE